MGVRIGKGWFEAKNPIKGGWVLGFLVLYVRCIGWVHGIVPEVLEARSKAPPANATQTSAVLIQQMIAN
jgi:hypothetical protein